MWIKGLFIFVLGAGVFLLVQVLMPTIVFKVWEVTSFSQSEMLADPHPESRSKLVSEQVLGVAVTNVKNFPAFYSAPTSMVSPYKDFYISIPSIKLKEEKVMVNSNDFEKNLAQLPGTALPGEKGNVFITGHSSIATNLLLGGDRAIFYNLPKIRKGDEIVIEALGGKMTYKVEGLKVVDPSDVSVINPPDNEGRYLTLMTCVPPGFNTKRLIVLATLQ